MSTILKKKSKKNYTYYGCEKYPDCDFMTWDVPLEDNCPECRNSMFKKSGRGMKKPFCINPECPNFLPEEARGYKKKDASDDGRIQKAPMGRKKLKYPVKQSQLKQSRQPNQKSHQSKIICQG